MAMAINTDRTLRYAQRQLGGSLQDITLAMKRLSLGWRTNHARHHAARLWVSPTRSALGYAPRNSNG